jgi:nucleotide-binding universal stress UspA family protein
MKILAGYDPPYADTRLLDRVISSARKNSAHVYLVTSLSGGRETESGNIDTIEEELDRAKAQLEAADISCETLILVRHRTPGEDLVCFAEENGVDEIIIQITKTSKVG